MSRRLLRSSWICSRCATRRQSSRRFLSTANASIQQNYEPPNLVTYAAPSTRSDDQTLRDVFDNKAFWLDFARRSFGASDAGRGLFCNRFLTSPGGFDEFATQTLQRARPLVAKIVAAKEKAELISVVKDMDRVSDILCRCLDIAEFISSTHPSNSMRSAASQAYGRVFEYMNTLNTSTELHERLETAMGDKDVLNSMSDEEKIVGDILLRDFSKSATSLSDDMKRSFVEKSSEMVHWGSEFSANIYPVETGIRVKAADLKGMNPGMVKQLTSWRTATLDMSPSTVATVLATVEDEELRKKMYVASRTTSSEQIGRLEKMLEARGALAKLGGFQSYAHMTLSRKMAKSPEAVQEFLQSLYGRVKPGALVELERLRSLKQKLSGSEEFNAWDERFYINKYAIQERSKTRWPDHLRSFFSIGIVMQGLSRILSRLYGVRLVPREPLPGETWNNDVRRLDVIDEAEGLIAVLYCDLFQREGKNSGPSHFTIRCSRHISENEVAETDMEGFPTREEAATDGMASHRNRKGELFQLPTIALICDFEKDVRSEATLLDFSEVQTLFHEMGHAVHSMLGRTYLHNVSGTRCAADFAEIPSILMENFVSSPQALALFARHHETGAPIPFEMVEARNKRHKLFENSRIESQIALSLVDQAYHSSTSNENNLSTTDVYHDIINQYSSIKEPKETNWQGLFNHLYVYGAIYYSYLFDSAVADKIWREVFLKQDQGVLSREAGDRFRGGILQWGGGKDPWKCLAGALNQPSLAEGGRDAMGEVGRWGLGNLS